MAGYGVSRFVVALDGSSANSAVRTSNPILVADANIVSISIQSVAAVASNFLIDGSNSDGAASALTTAASPNGDWSLVTTITAAGLYNITPGVRFLRATRPAANSQTTIVFAFRSF